MAENGFRALQRAKMSPQYLQLNTISKLHFSSKNLIQYSKTCLKGSLKKKTKTWFSK